jgi:hypothetical protein
MAGQVRTGEKPVVSVEETSWLSLLPDVLVRDLADALDIHPFMLPRWRRLAREGVP